jgi:hypothetical protein
VSTPPSSSFENEHTTETETESQEIPTTPPPSEQDQPEQPPLSEPEQPEEAPVTYPASTFPQEAEGEAHGGPLGCCLGVVVGLFLTMLIMVGISLLLANGAFLGAATLPVDLLGGAICGYLGWRIGQRVYRVYEQPVVIDKRRRKNRSNTRKTRSEV